MSELEVLQTAFARTTALVEELAPEDLRRPTPCSDWDVRALLVHIVAANDGLVAVLHGQEADWGKDALGDDPAESVRRSLGQALSAWSEAGALERPSEQMPGMRVVDFALADAVVHCWDLATALGQDPGLDPAHVQLVRDRWEGAPAETGRTYDVFGPEVPVADDARPADRLAGLLGRDPAFRAQPPLA